VAVEPILVDQEENMAAPVQVEVPNLVGLCYLFRKNFIIQIKISIN
jgi:hypothetical protein